MVRLNRTYYSLLKSTSKTVWYGLTVHIISFKIYKQNFQQNFQNCLPQSNSSELCKFRAVRPPQSTNSPKFAHFTLCFRHLPWQRTLQNSRELRKFRAVRPYSLRTTQNSHILLTYSILCFRHLPWQRTLQNSS